MTKSRCCNKPMNQISPHKSNFFTSWQCIQCGNFLTGSGDVYARACYGSEDDRETFSGQARQGGKSELTKANEQASKNAVTGDNPVTQKAIKHKGSPPKYPYSMRSLEEYREHYFPKQEYEGRPVYTESFFQEKFDELFSIKDKNMIAMRQVRLVSVLVYDDATEVPFAKRVLVTKYNYITDETDEEIFAGLGLQVALDGYNKIRVTYENRCNGRPLEAMRLSDLKKKVLMHDVLD